MLPHASAVMAEVADFSLRPPNMTASNLEALRPTDRILPVWKDLTPFPTYQEFKRLAAF